MERYCFENMFLRTEKIVTVSACDSDGIVVIYRHYLYWIASLFCRRESTNNGFYMILINKRASIVFEKTTEARSISYG